MPYESDYDYYYDDAEYEVENVESNVDVYEREYEDYNDLDDQFGR